MTIVRYLLVGIINTATGLGTIYFVMYFLQFKIDIANAFGYAFGIIVSFILNKKWTFKSYDRFLPSAFRFLLVLLIAYTANLYTVLYAAKYLSINPYFAQALGTIPYAAIGYLGNNLFTFRKKRLISH